MALSNRVWGAGKLLLLAAGLLTTYVLTFGLAMRLAVRSRNVVVPSLVGRTVNQASRMLTDLGLPLKVEEQRRLDPRVAPGVVLEQSPEAGATTRAPRSVRVWVSAGARATRVPMVIGLAERSAETRLQNEGFTLSGTAHVRMTDHAAGAVIAQSAGASGADVSLLVNQGARGQSYVMPDLIGTVASSAAEVLRARGFRVAIVSSFAYPGIPSGIVLRQAPQGGYQIAPGDPISLEVSQ